MEEEITEERVFMKVTKIREMATSSTSMPQIEQINLHFEMKKIIYERFRDVNDSSVELMKENRQPLIRNIVHVNHPQVFYSATTHEAIKKELSGWDISDYWREWFIKKVLCNTRDMLKSISSEHNVLDFHAELVIKQDRVFSSTDVFKLAIGDIGSSVISDADSSINSLEGKKIIDSDIKGTNSKSRSNLFGRVFRRLSGCVRVVLTCVPSRLYPKKADLSDYYPISSSDMANN